LVEAALFLLDSAFAAAFSAGFTAGLWATAATAPNITKAMDAASGLLMALIRKFM